MFEKTTKPASDVPQPLFVFTSTPTISWAIAFRSSAFSRCRTVTWIDCFVFIIDNWICMINVIVALCYFSYENEALHCGGGVSIFNCWIDSAWVKCPANRAGVALPQDPASRLPPRRCRWREHSRHVLCWQLFWSTIRFLVEGRGQVGAGSARGGSHSQSTSTRRAARAPRPFT